MSIEHLLRKFMWYYGKLWKQQVELAVWFLDICLWGNICLVESSSKENSSHLGLWIIQSDRNIVYGKKCTTNKIHLQYQCNMSIVLAEITEMHISKAKQIKPNLSTWLYAPREVTGWTVPLSYNCWKWNLNRSYKVFKKDVDATESRQCT